MKLTTNSFVEHRSAGATDVMPQNANPAVLLAPGVCTTCLGSTCCSSCCSASTRLQKA